MSTSESISKHEKTAGQGKLNRVFMTAESAKRHGKNFALSLSSAFSAFSAFSVVYRELPAPVFCN
jgi:hypothetical protein